MRQQGLRARSHRPFRVLTTDSRHELPVAPNRLALRAAPSGANEVWVTDITYIPTSEGWLYLAAVMDLWSRRIVGWAMSESQQTPLVTAALEQALCFRRPPPGLLHHSDRGCQYASLDYRRLLAGHQIEPSMSRAATATITRPWNRSGAASRASGFTSSRWPLAHRPVPRSSSGLRCSTTGRGSTARWAINRLWTLKRSSTKNQWSRSSHCPRNRDNLRTRYPGSCVR